MCIFYAIKSCPWYDAQVRWVQSELSHLCTSHCHTAAMSDPSSAARLIVCSCVVMWGEPLPSAGHQLMLIAAIRRCSLSVYPDFWFWEWYRRWCAIVRVPQFSHRYLLLCIGLAHLQSTIIRIRCILCALCAASVSLTLTPMLCMAGVVLFILSN